MLRRLGQCVAIDDLGGSESPEILGFIQPARRGYNAVAQLRQQSDGHRTHAAIRACHQYVAGVRRNAVVLQREHAEHGREAGRADRSRLPGADCARQLCQPLPRYTRPLSDSGIAVDTETPPVNDHFVVDLEGWIGRCFDGACEVDSRNQGEFLDNVRATRDGDAILVVDGRIVDRDGHIAFRQIGVRQLHEFSRLPRIGLADKDSFEGHCSLLEIVVRCRDVGTGCGGCLHGVQIFRLERGGAPVALMLSLYVGRGLAEEARQAPPGSAARGQKARAARAGCDAGSASSRRSFRIPASTRPAGANRRSNRRRFASLPAAYRIFGCAALAAFRTVSATTSGCSAVAITSFTLLVMPSRASRYASSLASGSMKFESNGVFVYAGSMTETRMPLVRSSWSSDSE